MVDTNKRNILIMAGGTGGHVFPAMAIARQFSKLGYTIHWIGTVKGFEYNAIPKAGWQLHTIKIQGLFGKGWFAWVKVPLLLLVAMWQTSKILHLVKPKIVIGLGSFCSAPGGLMARILGYPLVIQDQNAVPSFVNRLLANISNKILQGFPNVFAKGIYTGNPVRDELTNLPSPELRWRNRSGTIKILILGGSLGALALNRLLPEVIKLLSKDLRIVVWHQCGSSHLEITKTEYAKFGLQNVKIMPFIDDMAEAYLWADFVIARSGAMTIAELTAVGIGSLLIPFPYAIKDHQTHNGQLLVNAGAAYLIQQAKLDPCKLANLLKPLLSCREDLLTMAKAAHKLANPNAVDKIMKHCLEVTRE